MAAEADLEVKHDATGADGSFYVGNREKPGAELTYTLREGVATLEHTFVSPGLRSGGVGRRLVEAAVAWARAEGVRVRATCSYARAVLEATHADDDIRAP